MKIVISLLLISYATTISAREHPELCGGLQTGANPCRECDNANIALFGADPQYKSPSFEFPSSNNGGHGNQQISLPPPTTSFYHQVTCSGSGCGGIGPVIQDAPQQVLGDIGTTGMLSPDSNAKAVQTFQSINDLCSRRKGLLNNNFLSKQKKLIVRPARPSRIICKTDKPNSSNFGSGSVEYNPNIFQNKKITTAFNNVMNKFTHKNVVNSNSAKGKNKIPVFNSGNTAPGNYINQISSNTLISSGSVSNGFSQGTNIFSGNNLNTIPINTNTNTNTNTNSGRHQVFRGLTTLLSNNEEKTVNTGLKADLLIPVAYNNNNPNAQINNGQLNNGQLIISGQSSNGQFNNGQSTNGQLIINGQSSNGQSTNGHFFNVQSTTGQINGQLTISDQSSNGQFSNGNFFDVQSSTSQLNGQSKEDSQPKPSAIVNFIDPSSGNIRTMTREEFCDDKKLSFEEQEKIYKGEKQIGPVDAVSWQLYINKLLASLIKTPTFQSSKKIPEVGITYGYKQPPVNEYKKPEREIPEEVLHVADKPPVEFKNPAPNVNPNIILEQIKSSFKSCEPCNNKFIQGTNVQVVKESRVDPDNVPCGIVGTALPDYRPGTIEESPVSSEYSEGNYQVHSNACTCI